MFEDEEDRVEVVEIELKWSWPVQVLLWAFILLAVLAVWALTNVSQDYVFAVRLLLDRSCMAG